MWAVILILGLIIILLSYKLYECHLDKVLFDNIKWCVSYATDSSFNNVRPELKQRSYIIHLQTQELLEEKYKILETEFDIVNEILKSYQQDLLQRYFGGYALTYSKLSEEEYFIITFRDFLQKHQCEDKFNDEEIYAITYHKLLYISQLSSQNIYKQRGVN